MIAIALLMLSCPAAIEPGAWIIIASLATLAWALR